MHTILFCRPGCPRVLPVEKGQQAVRRARGPHTGAQPRDEIPLPSDGTPQPTNYGPFSRADPSGAQAISPALQPAAGDQAGRPGPATPHAAAPKATSPGFAAVACQAASPAPAAPSAPATQKAANPTAAAQPAVRPPQAAKRRAAGSAVPAGRPRQGPQPSRSASGGSAPRKILGAKHMADAQCSPPPLPPPPSPPPPPPRFDNRGEFSYNDIDNVTPVQPVPALVPAVAPAAAPAVAPSVAPAVAPSVAPSVVPAAVPAAVPAVAAVIKPGKPVQPAPAKTKPVQSGKPLACSHVAVLLCMPESTF